MGNLFRAILMFAICGGFAVAAADSSEWPLAVFFALFSIMGAAIFAVEVGKLQDRHSDYSGE